MEVISNSPLLLFSIQIELSSSCFSSISFPSFSASNQQGGGRGPIILSLHPHPNCFREIFIKPACSTNILKIFYYSLYLSAYLEILPKRGFNLSNGFLPPQAEDSKTSISSKLLFRPILSSSFTFVGIFQWMYVCFMPNKNLNARNKLACLPWMTGDHGYEFPGNIFSFFNFWGKLVATDWPRHRKPNQLEEKQVE